MELETLFTSGKWSIIELLSREELSPLQLSEILGTSVANISQQLKLLELIGLLSTRKLPNRERGKPRTLYSISQDFVIVISALKNFAKKSFIKANPIQSTMSRILCYQDEALHYPLMKLFWLLEPQLDLITVMVFNSATNTLQVATPKPSSVKLPNVSNLSISVKTVADFKANVLKSTQYPIYDPNHLLRVEVRE